MGQGVGMRGAQFLCLAVAFMGATCGAAGAVALPAPDDLPSGTVALVSDVPVRHRAVTAAEFRHSLVLVAAQMGRRTVPGHDSRAYAKVEHQAMSSLLEAAWIYGEADERGIAVTHAQVAREVASVKKESFKSEAEFHAFLKESHYTRRDVNERVEIQLLSSRLQGQIGLEIERQSRNESEERRAWGEFVADFQEKWRGRTVCAPAYATDRCSNGPAPA
jgi:parvulin-like peptidyl-prolyl isomerase